MEYQEKYNHLIGYIDTLGVFRLNLDPQHQNGYIDENDSFNIKDSYDSTTFNNLFGSYKPSEQAIWRKQLTFAWDLLKSIYEPRIKSKFKPKIDSPKRPKKSRFKKSTKKALSIFNNPRSNINYLSAEEVKREVS